MQSCREAHLACCPQTKRPHSTSSTMNKLLALCSALVATAIFAWGADALPNYEKTCASCHGKDGKGATKAGRKAGRDATIADTNRTAS